MLSQPGASPTCPVLPSRLARAARAVRRKAGLHLIAVLLFLVAAPPASLALSNDAAAHAPPATDTIRVLDRDTAEPVVGLTYQYGDQSGVSGRDGAMRLAYQPGTELHLSHVRYGAWSLSDPEVSAALRRGVIRRSERVAQMHPMTVVGVRGSDEQVQTLSIDAEERLAHDGGALLDRMPEIGSVKKSGSYGFDPVLRGFKNDRLTVLVNGTPSALAACPNRMDPPTSQVAPNMMERIEIRKGPHSLRFGPSFGGTINFVPVEPAFSSTPETYGRVSGSYERNGTVARSEGLVGVRGRSYDLGLYGAWSEGDDYDPGTTGSIPADFRRGSAGGRLGLRLSDAQQVTLTATRNVARDAEFAALPMDLRSDDTWVLRARHVVEGSSPSALQAWTTTASLTRVDHRMDNLDKTLSPRTVDAATDAETQTVGLRTEGRWSVGSNLLFAGADLQISEADGDRSRTFRMGPREGQTVRDNLWQDGQIREGGLFAEAHRQFERVRVVASGRLQFNDFRLRDPAPSFTAVRGDTEAFHVNPSVSLGATVDAGRGVTAGLWLGRAQRSGSLTERAINAVPVGQDPYEMLGAPGLDPEVNNQVDLTLGVESGGTRLDVDLFASYVQDYISGAVRPDLDPRMPSSPGVRSFTNLGEARLFGGEARWTQNLPLVGLQHTLGVAYTHGQDLTRDEPLPEVAPLKMRYMLSGRYLSGRLRPTLELRHVTEQDRVSESFGETSTPAFTVVDASARMQVRPAVTLSGGVQNVFDETYYEHLSRSVRGPGGRPIYAPGRSLFLSLSIDLTRRP